MLRKHLIFVLLVCIFGFAGCGATSNMLSESGRREEGASNPYVIARDTRDAIMNCVVTKDAIGISSLFCNAVSVSNDDVQNVLNVIEGEVSTIDTKGIVGGKKISKDGIYTVYTYAANMIVYTDVGLKYKVTISGAAVYEDCPNEIGIERFKITDLQTNEWFSVGRGANTSSDISLS